MAIEKLYPEYYRTPDASVWQRGSPAFAGSIFNLPPQVDSEVKFDVFETRRAVDKIGQLDKSVPANPFMANIPIPPMHEEKSLRGLEKDINRLEKTQAALAATGLVCPTTSALI